MSKSVANTQARDRFPAQRYLLLAVISIVALGAPAVADARSKAKPAPVRLPAAVMPARATTAAPSSVILRGADDSVTSKTIVEAPAGSILGGITVGKAPTATTADVLVEPAASASPQRPKDWYPESHSYLRPYHYKWRYWTPG